MLENNYSNMRVFFDSDVLISASLSPTGASYILIHHINSIEKYVSNYSLEEIKLVSSRQKFSFPSELTKELEKISLKNSLIDIRLLYSKYVIDIHDAHVIAGAVLSGSRFLITFNVRHYNSEIIKRDFDILVVTPGIFLQYLRSIDY